MSDLRLPWMKWFPRDFASATRGWPLIARAVYRELLDAQWDIGGSEPGTLPDDTEQLRELARANEAEWKIASRFVLPKFPRMSGGRRNARLEEHREAAVREFYGRKKGAETTNAKRWGNRSATQSANRTATRSATNGSAPKQSLTDSLSDSDSDSLSDPKVTSISVAQRSQTVSPPDPAPAPEHEDLEAYEDRGPLSEGLA